jgi:hypothetical protein
MSKRIFGLNVVVSFMLLSLYIFEDPGDVLV